ncbi:aminoglycoside N(3)-acetyltransferase [Halalkalibacter alkalisediminis]|uniref:Aminoglycoside N(3)-acetyltransferase n=1 Tax=Halalkalibacter alkalisediminis TaxID=935616 RepID=A0ABV6NNW8_9BACI|nr:AAC(3) family N-acetyltransferase [Halalkalibacter alkalisediminis]
MEKIIHQTVLPRTRQSISNDLYQLGIRKGMTVLVHSSLSSIGWVNGGAVAVIQALQDVITEKGTIVMPSQSTDLSDPSEWLYPPVPKEWWSEIRETMPAYDPHMTPTRGMGNIVEVFRTSPDVLRSGHPAYSFVAWGKDKVELTESHFIDFGLGEQSPLARLYQAEAFVLMIGVGYDSNTSFHLAEYRRKNPTFTKKGAPISINGEKVWKEYDEIDFNEECFEGIGKDFEKEHAILKGKIGSAESRLFTLKQAVDFAERWLNGNR